MRNEVLWEPKIVYTYGIFDLFHKGHVELLREAKGLGDKLIVGLFSDEVARSFKRKPVLCLEYRIHVVKHCTFVDDIVVQEDFLPDNIIKKIKPHVLAKGPGAGWDRGGEVPGEAVMRVLKGEVVRLEYHGSISTSSIIKKITGA